MTSILFEYKNKATKQSSGLGLIQNLLSNLLHKGEIYNQLLIDVILMIKYRLLQRLGCDTHLGFDPTLI